jgi:hypothetical protein
MPAAAEGTIAAVGMAFCKLLVNSVAINVSGASNTRPSNRWPLDGRSLSSGSLDSGGRRQVEELSNVLAGWPLCGPTDSGSRLPVRAGGWALCGWTLCGWTLRGWSLRGWSLRGWSLRGATLRRATAGSRTSAAASALGVKVVGRKAQHKHRHKEHGYGLFHRDFLNND